MNSTTTNTTNTTSSRPLLIFKHNPKAAGGSTLEILNEIKPLKFKRRTLTNSYFLIRNYDQAKNSSANDEKYPKDTFFKVDDLGEDLHKAYVHVQEVATLFPYDKANGFVISNIREPCSQYVSLWSFGSAKKGGFYFKLRNNARDFAKLAYGMQSPQFDSKWDISAFRNYWMRGCQTTGLMQRRFQDNYMTPRGAATLSPQFVPQVDCWVYVESYHETLLSCLQQYEKQGGSVNWKAPLLSAMVESLLEKENRRRLAVETKNNPLKNPQSTHHSTCETYFDNQTTALVENGLDSTLYKMFGYEGCCKKTYDRNALSHPLDLGTIRKHIDEAEKQMRGKSCINEWDNSVIKMSDDDEGDNDENDNNEDNNNEDNNNEDNDDNNELVHVGYFKRLVSDTKHKTSEILPGRTKNDDDMNDTVMESINYSTLALMQMAMSVFVAIFLIILVATKRRRKRSVKSSINRGF